MAGTYPDAPEVASLDLLRRPLRDLLSRLPRLRVNESGQPDFAAAEPDLLVGLAESTELLLRIVHDGFSAIGLLNAVTAPGIANGDIAATHTVAIGRLMVELAEVLAYAQALSYECRRHTADYVGHRDAVDDE